MYYRMWNCLQKKPIQDSLGSSSKRVQNKSMEVLLKSYVLKKKLIKKKFGVLWRGLRFCPLLFLFFRKARLPNWAYSCHSFVLSKFSLLIQLADRLFAYKGWDTFWEERPSSSPGPWNSNPHEPSQHSLETLSAQLFLLFFFLSFSQYRLQ